MSQLQNINTFKSNGGKMVLKRLPELEFFIKEVSIPSISVPVIQRGSQLTRLPEQGDSMIQSPLEVTFFLDEDAKNYIEIYNWLRAYSTPEKLVNYNIPSLTQQTERLREDVTITLNSLKNNAKLEFTFMNAFPTDLSSINIVMVEETTVMLTCTVTLEYDKPFDVTRI